MQFVANIREAVRLGYVVQLALGESQQIRPHCRWFLPFSQHGEGDVVVVQNSNIAKSAASRTKS